MTTLTADTLITRNPTLIAAEIDGELLMMSVERGEYFGITGVGSRVWELLATPTTIGEIARIACAEYLVDESACRADMQIFVEDLIQLGLASVV